MAYLLLEPFIIAILTSAVVAYIFFPLYEKFSKYLKNKKIAAFLVSLIIVLLVTIPSIFLLNSLSKEAYVIYSLGLQKLSAGDLSACETPGLFCDLSNYFGDLQTRYYLEQALQTATNTVINSISSFALSIPIIILNLFVVLFIIYYLFVAAPSLNKKVYTIIPYNKKHLKLILRNFNEVTYAIVYGVFVISVIEALLGMLGFAFIGASSPVLWGLMIGFLALIPMIGPTVVWVPALLIQLYYGIFWKAAVICVVGIIISLIDTFVKPVFLAGRADLNPALMLLGILGGLNLFGIIGIILGPLILSFFTVLFKIYMKERIAA